MGVKNAPTAIFGCIEAAGGVRLSRARRGDPLPARLNSSVQRFPERLGDDPGPDILNTYFVRALI